MSAVGVPRSVHELLRGVDGVPHVVLGPVLLVLAGPLSGLLGVPLPAYLVFVGVFVAYGAAVVVATRGGRVPVGLTVLAVKTNLAFLGVAVLGLAVLDLTAAGVVLLSVLAASAAVVAVLLVRLGRAEGRLV